VLMFSVQNAGLKLPETPLRYGAVNGICVADLVLILRSAEPHPSDDAVGVIGAPSGPPAWERAVYAIGQTFRATGAGKGHMLTTFSQHPVRLRYATRAFS
jgi:hypothetical protein